MTLNLTNLEPIGDRFLNDDEEPHDSLAALMNREPLQINDCLFHVEVIQMKKRKAGELAGYMAPVIPDFDKSHDAYWNLNDDRPALMRIPGCGKRRYLVLFYPYAD